MYCPNSSLSFWRLSSRGIFQVVLTGDLFQTALQYELIVGFTRLGNILGALDRQDISEAAQHTMWLGRRSQTP